MILLFSGATGLISLCFSHIVHGFCKNCIIHQLKQIFLKIIFAFFVRSVFISMYGFNQSFLLNLMILCTFSNTNQWFNAS